MITIQRSNIDLWLSTYLESIQCWHDLHVKEVEAFIIVYVYIRVRVALGQMVRAEMVRVSEIKIKKGTPPPQVTRPLEIMWRPMYWHVALWVRSAREQCPPLALVQAQPRARPKAALKSHYQGMILLMGMTLNHAIDLFFYLVYWLCVEFIVVLILFKFYFVQEQIMAWCPLRSCGLTLHIFLLHGWVWKLRVPYEVTQSQPQFVCCMLLLRGVVYVVTLWSSDQYACVVSHHPFSNDIPPSQDVLLLAE